MAGPQRARGERILEDEVREVNRQLDQRVISLLQSRILNRELQWSDLTFFIKFFFKYTFFGLQFSEL